MYKKSIYYILLLISKLIANVVYTTMENSIDMVVLCVVLSMIIASRLTNRNMEQVAVIILCLFVLSTIRNWIPIPTGGAVRRNPVSTMLAAVLLLLVSVAEVGTQSAEGWVSASAQGGSSPKHSSILVDTDSDSDSDSDIGGPWQESNLAPL